MTASTPNPTANAAFEKITALLKMPPLRNTADLGAFKAVYTEFYDELGPNGFMSDLIVYRIALDNWHMFELMRDRQLLVERRQKQQRILAAAQKRRRNITFGKEVIDDTWGTLELPQRQNAIRQLYKDADDAYDRAIKAPAEDIHYAAAIEGYEYLETIDQLIERYSDRISRLLRELSWCDATLAKRARSVSNRIIEGTVELPQVTTAEAPLLPAEPQEDEASQSSPST
jgi:hypothetical protein